ncbi:hypothetical protein KY289_001168 [Solanum tuberosum]|nr:hypothetical protein KY289_001168 [Solanum tuberosum]
MASSSLSASLSISTSSLHHLMVVCPINLKPTNYLIWRIQILQLMQVMKVTKLVQEKKLDEVETPAKDNNGKAIDGHEKASDSNWDELDVLLRT